MEVILRQDVPNLGLAGEIVKVKSGYGRNHLIPHGLAFPATAGNKKKVEAEAKQRAAKSAAMKGDAEIIASGLQEVTLTFTAKVGDADKLFGSITSADIAARLAEQGHTVDKRNIMLPEPIKSLGDRLVTIKLHPEVVVEIRVAVDKE
ncbi:MAG: 50S ribosomal protein L9 [Gemmatimonadales bacterium]